MIPDEAHLPAGQIIYLSYDAEGAYAPSSPQAIANAATEHAAAYYQARLREAVRELTVARVHFDCLMDAGALTREEEGPVEALGRALAILKPLVESDHD